MTPPGSPSGSSGSVLVIPFADGIGDFVMMLPLLRFVRDHYPDAGITVAASQRSALLLSGDDAALSVKTPSWLAAGPPRPRTRGPVGVGRLWPQALLAWLEGPLLHWEFGRARAFRRTLNLHHWWEEGYDFSRHWTPQLPSRPGAVHTLDYLAGRLERELDAALPAAQRRPALALRPDAIAWASSWWRDAGLTDASPSTGTSSRSDKTDKHDAAHTAPVVALVPASNMQLKRWPLAHWTRLADALSDAGCVPLLCLPPGEDPARALPARCRRPVRTVSAPLDRMAALLARCHLVAGVDTGLLHIAAAVGTRYVGLFGPTNPQVTGPYDRALGTTLVAPFEKPSSCRTCWRQFKYVDDSCNTLPASSCMTHLSVEDVLAACRDELGKLAQLSKSGRA